jgi:RecQ-mediated genome instability protein 1
MLVPEAVEILGGVVDELEAARARLVSEVNKPPRGKRYTWYTSEVMYT